MEKALSDRNVTLILVTHDRAFLEAIATGLLELDAGKAHMYAFGGNGCYDRYRQVGLGSMGMITVPWTGRCDICCIGDYRGVGFVIFSVVGDR